METKYFKIMAKDWACISVTIYVKGEFSYDYNNYDVIARAEDCGLDFDEIKYFHEPEILTKEEFDDVIVLSADGNENLYVAYER